MKGESTKFSNEVAGDALAILHPATEVEEKSDRFKYPLYLYLAPFLAASRSLFLLLLHKTDSKNQSEQERAPKKRETTQGYRDSNWYLCPRI